MNASTYATPGAANEHGFTHSDARRAQKVLDHADPATTMRSYIDHLDADAKSRAGRLLD
jgi:integrase